MTLLFDLVLPLLVIFIMTVLGTELVVADFVRLREYPLLVPVIVIGQWLAVTLVAGLLGVVLHLSNAIAGGALLVAAAPIAALSNFYTQLARGHLALAITLTAFSNVLAIVATPLVADIGFRVFLGKAAAFDLSVLQVAKQTMLGLLLPLLFGMAIRRFAPHWIARWHKRFETLGMLAIIAVLLFVVFNQYAMIREQFGILLLTSVLLTIAMLCIGAVIAMVVTRSVIDRRTLVWSFPARNLAVAVLLAANVIGQASMASFAAVLFATHIAILIPLALWLGRKTER